MNKTKQVNVSTVVEQKIVAITKAQIEEIKVNACKDYDEFMIKWAKEYNCSLNPIFFIESNGRAGLMRVDVLYNGPV